MSDNRWDQQIKQFFDYLRTTRQLSDHTLSNYQRDLKKFVGYCKKLDINDATNVHHSDVRQWVASEHRQGLASKSLQRSLSAVRSFYKFHSRQGIEHNPAQGVQAPKAKKTLPKTLNADHVQQFLSLDGDSWITIRDRAMLELFYSSGLRLSELVNLDLLDLDLKDKLVTVTGKGNKTRQLPVGSYALKALDAWLKSRATMNCPLEALFISTRNTRLTQRAVQSRLKKYSVAQGMDSNVHPHMLRHSFASHMLESSGDLRAVQELLGHANMSTTQVYTHLDFQHLSKVYDKAHPRANRKTPRS